VPAPQALVVAVTVTIVLLRRIISVNATADSASMAGATTCYPDLGTNLAMVRWLPFPQVTALWGTSVGCHLSKAEYAETDDGLFP
jgi:hypothetical protein